MSFVRIMALFHMYTCKPFNCSRLRCVRYAKAWRRSKRGFFIQKNKTEKIH